MHDAVERQRDDAPAGGTDPQAEVDIAIFHRQCHLVEPANAIEHVALRRLHRAVRTTLEHGIARQGSTLRNYELPDGGSGSMQNEFKVYGRGGEPCDRCGTPIANTRVAGRGTWFCPTCQAASSASSAPSRSSRHNSV